MTLQEQIKAIEDLYEQAKAIVNELAKLKKNADGHEIINLYTLDNMVYSFNNEVVELYQKLENE